MADVTPMILPTGGVDGLFGSNNGLLGGLILGSLLRNGGLFGGTAGEAAGAVATTQGVNNSVTQAAMQQQLADIKAAIPYNEAQMQLALSGAVHDINNNINTTKTYVADRVNMTSDASAVRDAATQAGIQAGFSALNTNLLTELGDIANHISAGQRQADQNTFAITNAVKDGNFELQKSISASTYELAKAVVADGDRTRSLITSQYEATLNRQLSEANNALAELRSRHHLDANTRAIEVTTTNNINQMQQQTQQQQQMQYLAGIVSNLANDLQYIRATNQAINIGSGTQRANPTNTNVMA